ncbi:MAG TPA: beta-ketoacyl synthase N-terminal-like domain-containing protein [Myxococcota bacterium]|nr:beta-ketoacyl synthase N-terminal-like domain-containing protein [Myxococcota bacterium]
MRAEREPIAICGIGCRMPGGARDAAAFWQLLRDGVDAIQEIPADRWNVETFYDPEPGTPGKINAKWGGFVDDIDQLDAEFFGISPREALRMDPQQRLLLEVAWEGLEDAGVLPSAIAGTHVGVFVGLSSTDYMLLAQGETDLSKIDAHTNTGAAMSIAANRISYVLDLRGPSIAVDTACSSSLVAVHLACQSLWNGEASLALAGGVNVLIKPEPYVGFSRLSMLSPDGRCRAFDARANGFVRSEGAALVVLKPYARALADGDRIYAIVRATAVNQDGRTNGLTVPNGDAQQQLVREACRLAGIEPRELQYVEAHGTGTLVGDPIEARALGTALAEGRADGETCAIGSVKTNIGHLEPAAGIAGLIKVALALRHGLIPPSLHFEAPNPNIPFDELKLQVQTKLAPWRETGRPPLAGVNSFGFGGTNAHAVLEAVRAPSPARDSSAERATAGERPSLVVLSARSADALALHARRWREFLEPKGPGGDVSLADVSYTSLLRRDALEHRVAIAAADRAELLEKLSAFAEGERRAGISAGRAAPDKPPRLAFVASGQGPQWWGMGRQLLESEPEFRAVVERADAIVRELGSWSLLEALRAPEAASRIAQTSIAQPCIFALQVGLARLLERHGVEPEALVGHSVGEVAAAYLAGALDFEQATRVIFHRGRCMDFADAHGRMLAAGLSAADAEPFVRAYGDRISLAASNGPSAVAFSGDRSAGPETKHALAEGQRRIDSIALVHEQLYGSSNLSAVNLARYTEALIPELCRASGVSEQVAVRLELVDVELVPERAIPCALVISELVTNALKHAFPEGRPGILTVRLERVPDARLRLTVTDDGIGLKRDFPTEAPDSLGLDLVAIFAKQLDAELEVKREAGTCFVLTFQEGEA